MLMFLGFGICLSAYYIYQNKESVFMNIAKASVRIEDIYLNYLGMSVSYLVPDHSNTTLLDQYNKYYLDRYVSNLSHQDKYNKMNNEYFVILKYDIKRKILCYVKNSFTFNEIELSEEDINFSSPIILCNVSIYETNPETNERKKLFDNIDVTECFNYLVNRNSRIILSNTSKYKEFWLYYLNYFLQNRNIFINYDNLENIELSWKIMDQNIKTTEGSEISLITNNDSTNISIIDDTQTIGINENENEYDSIDDINQIDFSKKNHSDINEIYSSNSNINEKNNDHIEEESHTDDGPKSLEVEVSDGCADNREIVDEDNREIVVEATVEDKVTVEDKATVEDKVTVEEDKVTVEEDKIIVVEENNNEIVETVFEPEVENIDEEIEVKLNIVNSMVQNIIDDVVKNKDIIQMDDLN